MFDVSQFSLIGKYIKMETINNTTFLFLEISNDKILKLIVTKGIKQKMIDFCSANETIIVKGNISTNNRHDALLHITKIMFLSNKN